MNSIYKQGECKNELVFGEVLGQGAFGKVYKAYRKGDQTKSPVAVKVFQMESNPTEKDIGMELVDGIIGSYLYSHGCNVSNVLDAYRCTDKEETGGDFLIVLDYIEGETLDKYVQRGVSNNIKFELTRKLLEGFNCLHKHNVYHRDIKLDNIMHSADKFDEYENKFSVVIIDFGVSCASFAPGFEQFTRQKLDLQMAKYVIDESCFKGLVGTGPYMPPEEIYPDPRAFKMSPQERVSVKDSYALGCVLYEIWELDGHGLYSQYKNHLDFEEILGDRIDDDYSHGSSISAGNAPPAVIDMVNKLTMYDPVERITIAEALDMFNKNKFYSLDFLRRHGSETRVVAASSSGSRYVPPAPLSDAPLPPREPTNSRGRSGRSSRSSRSDRSDLSDSWGSSWDSDESGRLDKSDSSGYYPDLAWSERSIVVSRTLQPQPPSGRNYPDHLKSVDRRALENFWELEDPYNIRKRY